MYEHVRALMSRHLPGYEIHSLTRLGAGLDNVVYEINRDLLVRLSRDTSRNESVDREAELLRAVAAVSMLPVPDPVFTDPDHGALCYRKVPGVPLLDHAVADPVLRPVRLDRRPRVRAPNRRSPLQRRRPHAPRLDLRRIVTIPVFVPATPQW